MGGSDEYLYSPDILLDLNLDNSSAKFNPAVSMLNPGEGLKVRPLALQDYERGFLQLLGELTSVGDISLEAWEARFYDMKRCKDTYYITVIEDTLLKKVIGAATLVVENKFIHECGRVGRVEDVVVSNEYRGKQLGKLAVGMLQPLAKKLGCYKVTLNCTDGMMKYYTGLGYTAEKENANFLCLRL
jgi:glucosamine-phosphate N-acetyltransferase